MASMTTMNRFSQSMLALALILIGGCSMMPRQPDLERLYSTARENVEQPPVIIIPGLMGTQLESDSDGQIWPGSVLGLVFSDYRHAALEIDPETLQPDPGDVRPGAIAGKFAGRSFYQPIIDTLENVGGFERVQAGTPVDPGGRYYYIYTYDWRLDNVESVRGLSRLVEQIRADHGQPDMKVDIIGHSMGGMIARYYLRYGTTDVTEDNRFPVNYHGADRVRRIVILGTPNMGSVESMNAFIAGRRIGLRRIPPEVMLTFPSFYQLFPHPLTQWLVDIQGRPFGLDPFDISTWKRFRWSLFNPELRAGIVENHDDAAQGRQRLELLERYFKKHIERGRRFMWSLTVEMQRRPWELVVFGGDCELTPARVVVEPDGGRYHFRLRPGEIDSRRQGVDYNRLMLEPGDGLVTKTSLLARQTLDPFVPRHKWSDFPIDYPLFLCENHSQLTSNIFFQDNLLQFLLSRD
ncbi:MAG: alpha/beta fold hydrolase [Wenzhouxiangellaceae bacterium]|nr:alpha/beta fold hydrolase [Wenzhouxiangellaceae bacterium]